MAEWLLCVYQATENSGPETENSAQKLAKALGAAWQRWDIQSILAGYHDLAQSSLGRSLSWETDDLALQNIQARVRAPGIWLLTNLRNALLISTVNRSEAAVGYSTMDGDTAGGLAPLAGISKRFLLEWLHWAQTNLPLAELKWVNALTPTAELRPHAESQTDEADLMPYPVLERIEYLAMVEGLSSEEIVTKINPELSQNENVKLWVERFYSLWQRNQWKRERYAPSFHLDTHNLDPRTWCRYPILSGNSM
jgi:NAD+ synthase (glutamine-hydrolysing)